MNKKILVLFSYFITILAVNAQDQCANLSLESTVNSCEIPTTTLEAHFLNTDYRTTDSYVIDPQASCLPNIDNSIGTGIVFDDDWSFIVNIGFEFCFYGNMYDQIIVSDNGKVSFDLDMALQNDNDWVLNVGDQLPNPNWQPNCIFGPFFDSNSNRLPAAQQGDAMSFKLINQDQSIPSNVGNRALIISFNTPSYGGGCDVVDSMLRSTITLYETSNVIDVEITQKNVCTAWNNGRALVGIQNKSATLGMSPVGRGTIINGVTWDPRRTGWPGNTTIDQPDGELWRFKPDGDQLDYSFNWYADYGDGIYVQLEFPNATETPTVIEVNPENDTDYQARLTYQSECSFEAVTLQETVLVTPPENIPNIQAPADLTVCENEPIGSGVGTFNLNQDDVILADFATPADFTVTYHTTYASASAVSTDLVNSDPIPNADLTTYTAVDGVVIYVRVEKADDAFCDDYSKSFVLHVNTLDNPEFSYAPSTNPDPTVYCTADLTITPITTVNTTLGGYFTITNNGIWQNPVFDDPTKSLDGVVNLVASGLGTDGTGEFEVTYTTPEANDCTNTMTLPIKIEVTEDASFNYPNVYCEDENNPIPTVTTAGGIFSINGAGTLVDAATGEIDLSNTLFGVYEVTYSFNVGGNCPSSVSHNIEIFERDNANFSYAATEYCTHDQDYNINANPIAVQSGTTTTGGVYSISTGGVLANTITGEIDLIASGAGVFTVTYDTASVGNTCSNTFDFEVTIVETQNPFFNYIDGICKDNDNPMAFDIEVANGEFSVVPAATIDIATGELDLTTTTEGVTYTITYAFLTGTCASSLSKNIFIYEKPVANVPTTLLTECNKGDGTAEFDLSVLDSEIIGGQTNVTLSYYPTQDDALNNTNELMTQPALVSENVWAHVVNDNGCFDIVEVPLEIEDCYIVLPEGFSPNSSIEQNQTFDVTGLREIYPNFKLVIYNRYGQLMYECDATKDNWNGKLNNEGDILPVGTYFYGLKLNDIQGLQYRGWVYLQQ